MKTSKLTRISIAVAALCTALVAAPVPNVSASTFPSNVRVCVENSTQLMRVKATCDSATETRESWSASAITPLVRAVCIRNNGTMGYSSEQRCNTGTKINFTVRGESSDYIYACVQAKTKLLKRVAQPERCTGRVLRWLLTKQEPGTCANRGAVCEVGDVGPGGGVVFFVDSSDEYDFTYLEAAKSNWYRGQDREGYTYCPRESGLISDTPTAIGTGEATTELLLNICNNNSTYDYPANRRTVVHYVDKYNYKGLTDWFIPSWDEMQEVITTNSSYLVGLRDVGYCTTSIAIVDAGGSSLNRVYLAFLAGAGFTSSGGECTLRPIRAE